MSASEKEVTLKKIEYTNINKAKNPGGYGLYFTINITKIINNPTKQSLALLAVLTGLDFSEIEIEDNQKEKTIPNLDSQVLKCVDEYCEFDGKSQAKASVLFGLWRCFVKREGLLGCELTQRGFGQILQKYYSKKRQSGGVYYQGLSLKNEEKRKRSDLSFVPMQKNQVFC